MADRERWSADREVGEYLGAYGMASMRRIKQSQYRPDSLL